MAEREPAFLGGDPTPQARTTTPMGSRGQAGGYAPGGWSPSSAPAQQPEASRVPRGASYHVAGFWRRLCAAAVDAAVLAPICVLLSWLAAAVAGVHLPAARHHGLDFWLDLLLGTDPALVGGIGLALGIAFLYLFVFQATAGRTLGMRLLRLRIIDLYGDRPSMARAGARTAGYLVCLLTLALGFLWIAFDSEKRGLHDWLGGTYVVREPGR